MIRFLTAKDHELIRQAKQLWKECFFDSDEFIKYYFSQRSSPCNVLCNIKDGVLVSMLHAIPHNFSANGDMHSAILVAGVCTKEPYRGKGYAAELLDHLHENVKHDAFLLQTASADMFKFYEKFGYETLCTYYALTVENTLMRKTRQTLPDFALLANIHSCFVRNFDSDFCGSVAYIENAMAECKTGASFLAYTDKAFALCSENDGTCEVMYVIGEYSDELKERICEQTDCRTVKILLSQAVAGAEPTPFNMIKTDIDLAEAGKILTNLYY